MVTFPHRTSYGVFISQLIQFTRVCSHVDDFNARNKCLTTELIKQGYRYHKLRKVFSKFNRRFYIICPIKISFTSRPIETRI